MLPVARPDLHFEIRKHRSVVLCYLVWNRRGVPFWIRHSRRLILHMPSGSIKNGRTRGLSVPDPTRRNDDPVPRARDADCLLDRQYSSCDPFRLKAQVSISDFRLRSSHHHAVLPKYLFQRRLQRALRNTTQFLPPLRVRNCRRSRCRTRSRHSPCHQGDKRHRLFQPDRSHLSIDGPARAKHPAHSASLPPPTPPAWLESPLDSHRP